MTRSATGSSRRAHCTNANQSKRRNWEPSVPRPASNRVLILVSAIIGLVGCATVSTTGPLDTPEVRPGVAAGYLSAEEIPDGALLLPSPPRADSKAFAADLEASEVRKPRGSPRWHQAQRDSNLAFPEAAGIFECALDVPVTAVGTPHLYRLLRRTRTDAALVSDGAKDKYMRTRPFVANGEGSCTPEKEAGLAQNGSFPSGHASVGWAWALILAEVAPERSDFILARGRSYGESRVVCNVHWNSDVVEGRFLGSAVVARLQGNADFRSDVVAARQEVTELRARAARLSRDCLAEAHALE